MTETALGALTLFGNKKTKHLTQSSSDAFFCILSVPIGVSMQA